VKLLVFSDIHNDWKTLERLLAIDADYYIAAGDQVTWAKGIERCGEILARRGDRMYVLPGNHESADMVSGLGYSSPTPFNTPGEYSEPQIAERLQRFAPLKPLVLVCHAPPYGTALDQIRPGLHGGSRAVREFIEKYQPEHFFCGHIHEAEGASIAMGRTRAKNVGKAGHLLELD
jgi:Icc-related predicted phosphoesterase